MHAQIKAACRTLKRRNGGNVQFTLTSGEQTPMGRILYFVYYRSNILDLVPGCTTGYPHNGGQHTFTFNGPAKDAVAFVELLKEVCMERPWIACPEVRTVANELSFLTQDIIAIMH